MHDNELYSRYNSKEYKKELKYKAKLREIEKHGELKLLRRELKAKKNSYKKSRKKIQTTKLIVLYLFLIMNIILFYSMWIMYDFRDLTYLGVLITDIAAQVLVFLIYSAKSYKENKSQADLEFEREKFMSDQDGSVG